MRGWVILVDLPKTLKLKHELKRLLLKFLILILCSSDCENIFLNNPQNLPLYIVGNIEEKIPTEKIIERIQKESATFQKIIADFENAEKIYLESHSIN